MSLTDDNNLHIDRETPTAGNVKCLMLNVKMLNVVTSLFTKNMCNDVSQYPPLTDDNNLHIEREMPTAGNVEFFSKCYSGAKYQC